MKLFQQTDPDQGGFAHETIQLSDQFHEFPLPSEMLFLPPLYPTGLLHLYGYNFHFDENIFYTIRNKQAVGNKVKLRFYILVCP